MNVSRSRPQASAEEVLRSRDCGLSDTVKEKSYKTWRPGGLVKWPQKRSNSGGMASRRDGKSGRGGGHKSRRVNPFAKPGVGDVSSPSGRHRVWLFFGGARSGRSGRDCLTQLILAPPGPPLRF